MFKYTIINKPEININIEILNRIFKTISETVKIEQKWILNIVFVIDEEIKRLNKEYRKKDNVTDVLSFHYFEDFTLLKEDDTAGEIILSYNKIISQAKEYWLWEEKEFYKLIIHSILHILWYDHEEDSDYKIMNEFENKIWHEIFDNNKI